MESGLKRFIFLYSEVYYCREQRPHQTARPVAGGGVQREAFELVLRLVTKADQPAYRVFILTGQFPGGRISLAPTEDDL